MGKLKKVKNLEGCIEDIIITLNQYGIKADIILQLGVQDNRVKPIGSVHQMPKLTKKKCPVCGKKLRTDLKYYWCIEPQCTYIGT